MSATIAKEEIAILMPNRLSHYFRDEPDMRREGEVRGPGLFARIATGLGRVVTRVTRRDEAVEQLSRLSDRELADIGLSRCEIDLVTDRAFVARRNRERAEAAFHPARG